MSSFLPQTIQEFLRVDETVVHLKAGSGGNFGSSEAAVTHDKRNNVCGVWLGLKIFRTNRLDFDVPGPKMRFRTFTSSS